ncbi:MAG TPA: uroporphyrinogen-III synthase, partial [Geminicoccaceae bacterium]|nr:uroporphyrinogen-III synthase [Geminicoccaceae bacterium]
DPVLEIRHVPLPFLPDEGVAAVAITSANAAHALAGIGTRFPVYAVGAATAAAARAAGATEIRVADGDGRGLAELVGRTLVPAAGAVLHLAGADVREGLEEALAAAGFEYRRAVVYEAVPTPGMAPAAEAALRAGRLGAALFYSPRTAALWADRVTRLGLAGCLTRAIAACMSEAVAKPLRQLPFGDLRVAAARDQKALLRCLEAGW